MKIAIYKKKNDNFYIVKKSVEDFLKDIKDPVQLLQYKTKPYVLLTGHTTAEVIAEYTSELDIFTIANKTSNSWQDMKTIYLLFKPTHNSQLTYTKEDELVMYNHESSGTPINTYNGFYWCKHNMDITLAMWQEDIISGMMTKLEILDNPLYKDIEWFNTWLSKIYIPPSNLVHRLNLINTRDRQVW